MLFEIMLFLLIGILAGIFTGLMPGIHINLVGALIISSTASFLFSFDPLILSAFIISMSITHVFVDFIPSVFLGAPEEGTELSVLPGHEMLSQGRGIEAIYLTSLGCIWGIFIFVIMTIPLYFFADKISNLIFLPKFIPFFLIAICVNLILLEKSRLRALFVFGIAGTLGLLVLNMDFKEPLLPLLTGLFGMSSMILSLNSKIDLKKQKTETKIEIKKLKPLVTASFFSPLSIFLPALSSGQIATIGNQFAKLNREGFLFLLGSVNALGMAFSFLALFLLGKTRTGSAVAIKSLLGMFELKVFLLILTIILISGFFAFFISKFLAKKFVYYFKKFEYKKISIATIALISIITLLASGFIGFFVLLVSTFTGVYCIRQGVNRINMMACLLLPTIVLYLF